MLPATLPRGLPATGLAPRLGSLATAFVVLALLALLFAPLLLKRPVERLRDEIEHAADPARTAVTATQYLLARQNSALRGYLLTRDSALLVHFGQLVEQEEQVHRRLSGLVRSLDAEAVARFAELRTLSHRWHLEVEEQLRERSLPAGTHIPELPFDQDIYLAALAAAGQVDAALVQATLARRDRIRSLESWGRWLQAGLVALALAAALVVARLSRRMQRLAVEAEARRLEAERALAEAARVSESKARLLGGVTHDVKNPLSAADGYAEILEMGIKGQLSLEQAEVVAGIRRSIRGALEILHDLLELSRAETGGLAVERQEVDLVGLAREVALDFQGAAGAAGHSLQLHLPPRRVTAFTDPLRVRQILGNLLSNAIKYTPGEGSISVEVSEEAREGAPRVGVWSVVRVTDSGAGIAEHDQERIFEEFQRAHPTIADGHGLGLAISRRIARLLDGEITVHSQLGSGSTFVLWLPARGPGAGPPA